jgi:histidyl-tRNA synthetase
MFRPWWFPEYWPQDQKKFDAILALISDVFQQYNYEHIWTPAVEPVEILKRGGDIVDKQVYGLYGLAQWSEDTKEYALHFDLTIPLARYILDHRQELSFPFKRYQMQPVRRGERTKRWRFKEFWQFDVDVVRPSASNVGVRYDIETVAVLDHAMQKVTDTFGISLDRVCKIAHIGVTKSWLSSLGVVSNQDAVLWLLDNYFKFEPAIFEEKLAEHVSNEQLQAVLMLIATKDTSVLIWCDGYEDLQNILSGLTALGVTYEYDVCIVRGHSYYKGMVCEWFQRDDIALGSLAGGGRYDNVTDFIDPKQSFSWVGTSLWRFVYAAIDQINTLSQTDSYLLLNFEETFEKIISLYTKFIADWKTVELYPTDAKFGKQLDYANKKWITHAVILWSDELARGIYKVKDLVTGDERIEQLATGNW